MGIIFLAFGGLFLNFLIGAAVLASIDDDRQTLFRWYCDCPMPILGPPLVLTAWPLIWLAWSRKRYA